MHIAVFGAGASGGHLAVRLMQEGHQVAVVARGPQLVAIRDHGLVLHQGEQRWACRVHASDDTRQLGAHDLVFVTTKATALGAVADTLKPLVARHTKVVFVQNGMPWWYPLGLASSRVRLPELPVFGLSSKFLRYLQPDQVVAGVLYSANEVQSPGVVVNNSPSRNALVVGSVDSHFESEMGQLRELLVKAHFESPVVDEIRTEVWAKLVLNACASSIAVATGSHTAIADFPEIRETFIRAVEEAGAIARAYGHEIAMKLDLTRWTTQRPRHKPSMLQDLEAGRPMEIAEIIEAPLSFARSAGVPCPTLVALAALAKVRADQCGGQPNP
jgi:2-dehydropantoate 2-reductase